MTTRILRSRAPRRTAEARPNLRVGVDIGGSKVAVLVVDQSDAVLARRSVAAASAEPD